MLTGLAMGRINHGPSQHRLRTDEQSLPICGFIVPCSCLQLIPFLLLPLLVAVYCMSPWRSFSALSVPTRRSVAVVRYVSLIVLGNGPVRPITGRVLSAPSCTGGVIVPALGTDVSDPVPSRPHGCRYRRDS